MSTKLNYSEIKSKEDVKLANAEMWAAVSRAPEKDRADWNAIIELIELNRWHGKIEYPMPPLECKNAFNIKKGVFHSTAIYLQIGKVRFTRTEFNHNVFFGEGKKGNERD